MTSRQSLNASLAKGHLRRGDAHAALRDEGAANAHYDRARSYARSLPRSAFGTCAERLSELLGTSAGAAKSKDEISVATIRMGYGTAVSGLECDAKCTAEKTERIASALVVAGTPDFVAIQQLHGETTIDGYRLASTHLDLAVFVPPVSEWRHMSTVAFESPLQGCDNAPAAVSTFRRNDDRTVEIVIANIVVCRGENLVLLDQEKLRRYKTEGLLWCVDRHADLIVGDFNADEDLTNTEYLTNKTSKQKTPARRWTPEKIAALNRAPFDYLRDNGYVLAGTSRSAHGGKPICIWYKTSRLRPIGSDTIPLIDDLITRDGLAARFLMVSQP